MIVVEKSNICIDEISSFEICEGISDEAKHNCLNSQTSSILGNTLLHLINFDFVFKE